MKTFLSLLCALMLLPAAVSAKRQCDYNHYEYLCLVPKKCLEGSTAEDTLVMLEPDMTLSKRKCETIIQFKFVNDFTWIIGIKFTNIGDNNRKALALDANRVLYCDKYEDGSEIVGRTNTNKPNKPAREGRRRSCEFEIRSPFGENPRKKLAAIFKGSQNLFFQEETQGKKIVNKISFEGSLDKLVLAVITTKGCNENLIMDSYEPVSGGEIVRVSKRLIGENAEINCKSKKGEILYIIRENDSEWEKVHSVFCKGNVWAYRKMNEENSPVFMGKESFQMKCIRNWCKYCGELVEMPCEAGNCEPVMDYDNCVPKCPRDLWYFGKFVRRTSMRCMEVSDEKGKYEMWMANVNGVDTPVASASCYIGPFPLLETTTTNSAASASLWSIIAFNIVLLA